MKTMVLSDRNSVVRLLHLKRRSAHLERLGLIGVVFLMTGWFGFSEGTGREEPVERSSETNPVTFTNVAAESGIDAVNVWGGVKDKRYIVETKGSGLAFFDFDHDGWLDLYFTNGVRFGETYTANNAPVSRLYRNNQDGTFVDVSGKSGLAQTGWQTGVCIGDYDNDGWDDLFCGFWGQSRLFHNNGDGTFTDVTRKTGLIRDEKRWASGCTFMDYDRDGFLDLYSAGYIDLDVERVPAPGESADCVWKGIPVLCGPRGLQGAVDILYHNNGNGTFKDVTGEAGIDVAGPNYSITPVAADFNNDDWPDIYVAVDSEPSVFYVNQKDGTFEELGMLNGCAYSEHGQEQAGMGIGVGDFNVDGWLDIFKTNFQHDSSNLYLNNGDGSFRDISTMAGTGTRTQFVNWGAGFMDYDNDGWIDIFYVTGHVYPRIETYEVDAEFKTPRIAYRNLGNGKFRDESHRLGPGVLERFSSRGCAFGDYDNDGDIDVVVLNMNDPYSLLRNDGGNKNSWIKIKLIGTVGNRSAIGARVRVVTGSHSQIDEVRSGGSVMSQNDLRLHFGLGSSTRVDLIEVKWPMTGKTEHWENIDVNQIITIREEKGILRKEG